jgi:hypothetical protein
VNMAGAEDGSCCFWLKTVIFLAEPYFFSTLSHNQYDFGKKLLNTHCFLTV